MAADTGEDGAVPGLDPNGGTRRGQLVATLDVDGQLFEVRTHAGGTDYDWVNGPNEGYGFGSSGRELSDVQHRESIRGFLSMINPKTGFIG